MLHSGQGLPAFDWGSMLGMDFLTSYHDHLFSPFEWLLYSFDQLVIHRRPFCFAILLALFCAISPYFGWMVCVFLLLYFIVRTASGSFPKLNLRLFLRLALETLGGVAVAGLVMLPFYEIVSNNARASETILGRNLLAYEEKGVILRIIQSIFLPPELSRSGWYFKDIQLSLSPPVLYIPLFTVIGVILIWKQRRRAWYSLLLVVCAVIACVPLFNSVFSLFNVRYYGRWLFMPLLVMIMMTGLYLDDFSQFHPRKELTIYGGILGFWIVYGIYAVYIENDVKIGSQELWLTAIAVAVSGLIVLYLLHYPNSKLRFISVRQMCPLVCFICVLPLIGESMTITRKETSEYVSHERSRIWNDFTPIELKSDTFFRTSSCLSDPYALAGNRIMEWDYPSINHFNSMHTTELTNFFDDIGTGCTQAAFLTQDDYAVCSFLSGQYEIYYNQPLTGGVEVEPEDITVSMEGFVMDSVVNHYVIFRNTAFVPMGFTYDYYLPDPSEKQAEDDDSELFPNVDKTAKGSEFYEDSVSRQKLLLKAIWLTEEQIQKYGRFLKELPSDLYDDISIETYYQDCKDRAANACYAFEPNNHGFTASIDLPHENLVFFSVPYTKSFTAFVDGSPTEIERVFNGLCAVYVPEGDHTIEFRYEIPNWKTGCMVSVISLSVLLLYTAMDLLYKRKAGQRKANVSE